MTSSRTRAFSLVELVAVMVILGVLSVAAIPSLGALSQTRKAALAVEIERRLLVCKAWASGTGEPAGLKIDTANQLISSVRLVPGATGPTTIPGPTGDTDSGSSLFVPASFPGVSVASISTPPNSDNTIWFAHDGTPQARSSTGTLIGPLSGITRIVIADGPTVSVIPLTGVVER